MLKLLEDIGEDGLNAGFVGYVEGVADYCRFVAVRFDCGFGFVEETFAAARDDYGFCVCLGEGYCCGSSYTATLGLSGLRSRKIAYVDPPAPVIKTTLPSADNSGFVGSIAGYGL